MHLLTDSLTIFIFINNINNIMKQTSITIKESQFSWVNDNGLNLSKVVRNFLDFLIDNQSDFHSYLEKFKQENMD